MKFLVKLFPEITIKSRPVRQRFIRQLRRNIKAVLQDVDPEVQVHGEWDVIEVVSAKAASQIQAQGTLSGPGSEPTSTQAKPTSEPTSAQARPTSEQASAQARPTSEPTSAQAKPTNTQARPTSAQTSTPALIKAQLLDRLLCTPGIAAVHEVEQHPLPSLDGILQLVLPRYAEALAGKTFAVRCRRTGQHSFRSMEVERQVGAGLSQHTKAAGVDLTNPQLQVQLEIRHEQLYLVAARHPALGGYPLGCQGSALSLISGGFDSAVSSYLCIRRGLQTHYCFFNLGGRQHELAVKELAIYLWLKYHRSHRVKFITVPFEQVVAEILQQVDNSQMGVVLKRMMLRAADHIARQLHIPALVTGEKHCPGVQPNPAQSGSD